MTFLKIENYHFTLDANGNRTNVVQNEPLTLTPNASNVDYTYNTKKNRLLTAGTTNFAYDNEGQLNSGYSVAYAFDYEHRLKSIAGTTTFYYDGSGKRLKAVRGGAETRYIYDASGNLLAEADGSNNITKYYIYGAGLLAMVKPTNEVYTYHFNAVGSTVAMTDSGQNMVNKYSYDAFGNIAANSIENVQQPFKFVGQYGVMTEPNNFYYMRARYYDPNVGRFISEDPIGFEGGDVNLMVYVGNNPILLIDPWGLCSEQSNRVIGSRGGQPMVYNTETRQYNLGYPDSYQDPFVYSAKETIKTTGTTYLKTMDKISEIQERIPDNFRPSGKPYPGFLRDLNNATKPLRQMRGLP